MPKECLLDSLPLVYLASTNTWHFAISTQQHLLCHNWGELFHTPNNTQLLRSTRSFLAKSFIPSWPTCEEKQKHSHRQRKTSTISYFYHTIKHLPSRNFLKILVCSVLSVTELAFCSSLHEPAVDFKFSDNAHTGWMHLKPPIIHSLIHSKYMLPLQDNYISSDGVCYHLECSMD